MQIRPYYPTDAAQTPVVFYAAVRRTAARDYTAEELEAWAPDQLEQPTPGIFAQWNARHLAAGTYTWVAEEKGAIVGFIDLLTDWRKHVYADQPYPENSGYINLCFVHPDVAGRGVARALLDQVLTRANELNLAEIWVHTSRTSHGFFEHLGFETTATNQVPMTSPSNLVMLENFTMRLVLQNNPASDPP